MSIEQAIHEHWSTYFPLTSLVPVARLTTGFNDGSPDPADPYVELERFGESERVRTSSGSIIYTVLLRMRCVCKLYATAKMVGQKIVDHFNRADFPWSQGRVLDMKPINESEQKTEDGIWEVSVDFQTRTLQTSGT